MAINCGSLEMSLISCQKKLRTESEKVIEWHNGSVNEMAFHEIWYAVLSAMVGGFLFSVLEANKRQHSLCNRIYSFYFEFFETQNSFTEYRGLHWK